MTERSIERARRDGASMGRAYVDKLMTLPGAINKVRETLKTKTLTQVSEMVVSDVVRNPQLLAMYSKAELEALTAGFLETGIERIKELLRE
jgi:hypothetical protein